MSAPGGSQSETSTCVRGSTIVQFSTVATYALRAPGPLLAAAVRLPDPVERVLPFVTPAVLAGLVVTATFADGERLVIDARAVGLAAAAVGILVRAPLLVVVLAAAAATAAARALG